MIKKELSLRMGKMSVSAEKIRDTHRRIWPRRATLVLHSAHRLKRDRV